MKKIVACIVVILLFSVPFLFRKEEVKERVADGESCERFVQVEGETMPLEQYVVGVIAAEMPAAYELEALKAQAIAARTYALYKLQTESDLKASVLHQVFYTAEARQSRWQQQFDNYEQKVTQAVEETASQVLLYNGELISAMFHAASNGATESAKNYSGHDIPYLRSVSSPEREVTTKVIEAAKSKWTADELLKASYKVNETGRVQSAAIAGDVVSGRVLREELELRSTDFHFKKGASGELVAVVSGYGHGVGMSQQGANMMAASGATAEDILLHYYSGVTIEKLACEGSR